MLVDLIHARACKPFCEKSLTLPVSLTRLNHLICYGFYYWGTFESNMSSECLAQSNRLFLIVCFLPYATLICIS